MSVVEVGALRSPPVLPTRTIARCYVAGLLWVLNVLPRGVTVKTFDLDTRGGGCVEEFVRLVHPVQLQQAWRLLLPQCGRGKRRRREELGAIANESGVFVGPLDLHRDFYFRS
jgi:hypothetical protein